MSAATSTTTTPSATTSPGRGIALSVLVTTVVAGVLNTAISFAAQAMGADPATFMGLQPVTYLVFTLIGALAGAIGWQVVRRRAANPAAVLRWLVPVVVVVSLIPDVLVGMSMGWIGGIALGLMHLAVVAVAVPAYRRFLPLAR